MFFVEAGAENPVAAGCVSAAISMLYRESADAAIPVGAFAGHAFRSWLRHLFCGSSELDLMEQLCERVEDVLTI